MDPRAIYDLARVSLFLAPRALTPLEWLDLSQIEQGKDSGNTLIQSFLNLESIQKLDPSFYENLTASLTTEAFYRRIIGRDATDEELRSIESIAPIQPVERALWLSDLIINFTASEPETQRARLEYLAKVEDQVSRLNDAAIVTKFTKYCVSLLDWSPDPALSSLAVNAINLGFSWDTIAGILLSTSEAKQKYGDTLEQFVPKLLTQLLFRDPTADEISIVSSLAGSNLGLLASALIDFLQGDKEQIGDYAIAGQKASSKTAIGLLIQEFLPDLKVNTDYASSDKSFLAAQELVRTLSNLAVGRDVVKRFLTQVSESPNITQAALAISGKGVAIDGYLAGASVYVDLNGNGILDTGEPQSITDANGGYALDGQIATVTVVGGVDTASGKPFEGILRAPAGSTVVTPLTTLVSALQESGASLVEATQNVLKALKLDDTVSAADLLTVDPIKVLTNSTDSAAINTATKLAVTSANVINLIGMTSKVIQAQAGGASLLDGTALSKEITSAFAKEITSISQASGKDSIDFSRPDSLAPLINVINKTVAKQLPLNIRSSIEQSSDALSKAIAAPLGNIAVIIQKSAESTLDPSALIAKVLQAQNAAQGTVATKLVENVTSGRLNEVASYLSAEIVTDLVSTTKVISIQPNSPNDLTLIQGAGVVGVAKPTTQIQKIRLSADTGASNSDYITSTALQTITANLSAKLRNGETVQGSVDGGLNWFTLPSSSIRAESIYLEGITLLTGQQALAFRVAMGADFGPTARQPYQLLQASSLPTLSELKISDDTGLSSLDFVTRSDQQTITAKISRPLQRDESLFGSLDGGKTYIPISDKAVGETLRWNASLTEGVQSIRIHVRDAAGNQGVETSQPYQLDKDPPVIALESLKISRDTGSSDTDFVTNISQQVLSVRLSRPLTNEEYLFGSTSDGLAYENITALARDGNLQWPVILSGQSQIRLRLSDLAGNIGTTLIQPFSVDILKPSIVAIEPSWGSILNSVEDDTNGYVRVTTSGVETGQALKLSLNGKSYSETVTSSEVNIQIPAIELQKLDQNNKYVLSALVSDRAGNASDALGTDFVVNRVIPSIGTIVLSWGDLLSSDEATGNGSITVNTALIEDGRVVSLSIIDRSTGALTLTSSGPVINNKAVISIPSGGLLAQLKDGSSYTVTAVATNAAGNAATLDAPARFDVDTSKPQIKAISSSWGDYLSDSEDDETGRIVIETLGLEDAQQVRLVLNGVTYSGTVLGESAVVSVGTAALQALKQGEFYQPLVYANDRAGNSTASIDRGGFLVDRVTPSIESVSSSWGKALNAAETKTDQKLTVKTLQMEDGSNVTVELNGKRYQGAVVDNQVALTISATDLGLLAEGKTYSLKTSAARLSGNEATIRDDSVFVVDRVKPTINVSTSWGDILNADESTNAASISIMTTGVEKGQSISIDGIDGTIQLSTAVDGSANVVIPTTLLLAFPPYGAQTLTVTVQDQAGNPATAVIQFVVNRELPIVNSTAYSWGRSLNELEVNSPGSVTAMVSNAAPGSIAELQFGGSTAVQFASEVQNGLVKFDIPAAVLQKFLDGQLIGTRVIATDRSTGNKSLTSESSFVVDRSPPILVSSRSSWGATLNDAEDDSEGFVYIDTVGVEDGRSAIVQLNGKYFAGAVFANKATVSIPATTLRELSDAKSYSIDIALIDAADNTARSIGLDSFVVDRKRPMIGSVVTSWGSELSAGESERAATVKVNTSGVEDGQRVGITIDGRKFFEASVLSGIATVPIPASELRALQEGFSYVISASVNNQSGNAAPTNRDASFTVDRTGPGLKAHSGESPSLDFKDNWVRIKLDSEADAINPPAASQFSATMNGERLDVLRAIVSQDPRTGQDGTPLQSRLELSLSKAPSVYDVIRIYYRDTSEGVDDSTALQDGIGNDALSFEVSNQPSAINPTFMLTRAGVKAEYFFQNRMVVDPIAAFDIFIPASKGFAISALTSPLTVKSSIRGMIGQLSDTNSVWRAVGLAVDTPPYEASSMNNMPLASVMFDRFDNSKPFLALAVSAYDAESHMVVGSRVMNDDGKSLSKVPEAASKFVDLFGADLKVSAGLKPIFGTTGNDILLGSISSDILISFTGRDTVTPGGGADGVLLSTGAKTILQNQGDSGLFFDALKNVKDPWLSISTASFDLVSGFGLRGEAASDLDQLDLPNRDYRYVNAPSQPFKSGWDLSDGDYTIIRGDFDPLSERFDFANDGPSSLLVIDYGQQTEAIVLVGFGGFFTDDGVFGLLTAIPPSG